MSAYVEGPFKKELATKNEVKLEGYTWGKVIVVISVPRQNNLFANRLTARSIWEWCKNDCFRLNLYF